MPCLVWDAPEGRRVFELDRAVQIVGRDPVADLVVEEATVSRRHALLQTEDGVTKITDLGSSSGTKINGARITPDLPSSLEPGDFIQIGRIVFTVHKVAPPAAPPRQIRKVAPAPAPTPPKAKPKPKPTAAAPTGNAWKGIALAAGFVLVGLAGALIAVLSTSGDEKKPEPAPVREEQAKVDVEEPAEEPPDPEPLKEPPPKVDDGPKVELAPPGDLPPTGFCSVRDFPDLLEFDGDRFYPVRIEMFNGTVLQVIGSDGRMYELPQGQLRSAKDRMDLAHRAARKRAKLGRDDLDGHLSLARWCAARFVRSETKRLASRVLELRPNHPEATALLRSTE